MLKARAAAALRVVPYQPDYRPVTRLIDGLGRFPADRADVRDKWVQHVLYSKGKSREELRKTATALRRVEIRTQARLVAHASALTPAEPDKGAAVLVAAGIDGAAIATIGDAPNDAGLFVAGRFGATVGTADVLRQRAVMPAMPELVTRGVESAGFLELAALLVATRQSSRT